MLNLLKIIGAAIWKNKWFLIAAWKKLNTKGKLVVSIGLLLIVTVLAVLYFMVYIV